MADLYILLQTLPWKKVGNVWIKYWNHNLAAAFVNRLNNWDVFLPYNLEEQEDIKTLSGTADTQENAKLAADHRLNELCEKYSKMNIKVKENDQNIQEVK